jgi:hypothetical protein
VSLPCHYCEGDIGFNIGLDRKDNTVGYSYENVVPCCGICNSTKGKHLSYDEMLQISFFLKEFRLNRLSRQ